MSWFSRLFGAPKQQKGCLDIVSEYGAVLEGSKLDWAGVHDIADLPFEKATIKSAIFQAAEELRDFPEQIDVLGSGLVMLGTFQPLPNGVMQMPKPEEVEAMNQNDFKAHIQLMMDRKDGDLSASKQARAESEAILGEWKAHLASLGIANV